MSVRLYEAGSELPTSSRIDLVFLVEFGIFDPLLDVIIVYIFKVPEASVLIG